MPAATATKNATDAIYTITMVGLYFSHDAGQAGRVHRPYEVKWECPAKLVAETHPHTIFKRNVAPKLMPRLYSDYICLATFQVASATCTNPELVKDDINMQNKFELEQFIADRAMKIDPSLFDDDMELRQAIIDYRKDTEAFMLNQQRLLKHKKGDINIRRALEETIDFDGLLALNGVGVAKPNQKPRKPAHRVVDDGSADKLGDL